MLVALLRGSQQTAAVLVLAGEDMAVQLWDRARVWATSPEPAPNSGRNGVHSPTPTAHLKAGQSGQSSRFQTAGTDAMQGQLRMSRRKPLRCSAMASPAKTRHPLARIWRR